MKNLTKICLFLIILLAFGLRVYQLNTVPPSLDWDEVDVGYNAFTIANYGHDEWGKAFPLTFQSFGDYKSPVHIYLTALVVKLLGLSDFAVRLPMALVGTLSVLMIFFLARELFKNDYIGIIAALVLAVSPYSLQFSRFNHEGVVAVFVFMLALYLFLKGIRLKNWLLPLGFICFGITLITYHPPKIVTPIFLVLLIAIYFKELLKVKKLFVIGLLGLGLVCGLFFLDPNLSGLARSAQTSIPDSYYMQQPIYAETHNLLLAKVKVDSDRYLSHFSLNYLFIHGDQIARHSTQLVGEFYIIDLFWLLIGVISLIKLKNKSTLVVFSWALLAPLPASITGGIGEAPHAARAILMMGSWHLIIAFGLYSFIILLKRPILKKVVLLSIGLIYLFLVVTYLRGYYTVYPIKQAIEWQYGVAKAAQYVKDHPHQYQRVFVTAERSQPYIFFLYTLKVPLPEYLDNVTLNQDSHKSSNLVSIFWFNHTQYNFGNWDPIESMPDPNVLYILTPSEYDGLRHKTDFEIKDLIKYPSGVEAFFLVSKK